MGGDTHTTMMTSLPGSIVSSFNIPTGGKIVVCSVKTSSLWDLKFYRETEPDKFYPLDGALYEINADYSLDHENSGESKQQNIKWSFVDGTVFFDLIESERYYPRLQMNLDQVEGEVLNQTNHECGYHGDVKVWVARYSQIMHEKIKDQPFRYVPYSTSTYKVTPSEIIHVGTRKSQQIEEADSLIDLRHRYQEERRNVWAKTFPFFDVLFKRFPKACPLLGYASRDHLTWSPAVFPESTPHYLIGLTPEVTLLFEARYYSREPDDETLVYLNAISSEEQDAFQKGRLPFHVWLSDIPLYLRTTRDDSAIKIVKILSSQSPVELLIQEITSV